MANVTFIIGNGLDISLGLDTRYRDFYKYVQKRKPKTKNRIYSSIQQSPKTWADFELQLGKYSLYIDSLDESGKAAESESLLEELEEVRDDLAEYLETQEKRLKDISVDLRFNEKGFFDGLSRGQRIKIEELLSNQITNVDFISLNYTSTLEKILSDSTVARSAGWRTNAPLHIHGDLYENLTLGVSSVQQVSQSMTKSEQEDLVKPLLIASMNDGRIDDMRSMIYRSNIIVLFGVSLGETDAYIWTILNDWLRRYPNAHMVIHKHDSTYTDSTKRSSRRQKQYIQRVQDRLISHSKYSNEQIESMRKKIFVIHNTKKLFIQDKQASSKDILSL